MKKFITITAAIVLSAAVIEAHAEEATCEDVSDLAEVVMDNRQNGVSMALAMGAASGNEMVEAIVIGAYEMPSYSSSEFKRKAVREFADQWHLRCVKGRR